MCSFQEQLYQKIMKIKIKDTLKVLDDSKNKQKDV